MKIKILEVKKKITGYRIYEKVEYMKRNRNWHYWRVIKGFSKRYRAEIALKKIIKSGRFRIARMRTDGSCEWLLEGVNK